LPEHFSGWWRRGDRTLYTRENGGRVSECESATKGGERLGPFLLPFSAWVVVRIIFARWWSIKILLPW